MTLQSTGAISMANINTELGLSTTAQISLNDTAVRNLLGKTTALSQISLADAYGKSSVSYAVSPSTTSVNEGSTVTFTITTTGVANGTTLYYTNSGTTSAADFNDGVNSGSFTINSNTGSVAKTLTNDQLYEGSETIIFEVRTGSTSGTIVKTATTVTVNDTSIPSVGTPSISATVGSGQLLFSWSATNAANYNVVFNGSTIYTGTTNTSYNPTGLNNGTSYSITVTGNATNYNSTSNTISSTPLLLSAPGTPTFSGTAYNTTTVSWTTSGTNATSYTLLRSTTAGSGYSSVASSLGSGSYTDSTVSASTTYYYIARSVNALSQTADSSYNSVAIPAQPVVGTPSIGITVGSGQLTVSWSATNASTYNVLFNGSSYDYVGTTTTSYTKSSLSNGTQYSFTVYGIAPGYVTSSATAYGTPVLLGAPGTPTFSSQSTSGMTVSWTAGSGATYYYLQRSTDNVTFSYISFNATSPYGDSGLSSGTTYYYRAISLNASGQSAIGSSAGSATLTPTLSAPATATVTLNANKDGYTPSWSAVTNATGYSYSLYHNGSLYSANTTVGQSSTTGNAVSGLAAGTTVYVTVAATASGYTTSAVTQSSTITIVPILGTPSFTASTGGDKSVTFTWGAVTSATSYDVSFNGGAATNQSGVTYTASSLSVNTTYTISVVAKATNYTNSTAGTSSATTYTQLATPTGLTATGGDQSIAFSWTAVTNAAGYNYSIYLGGSLSSSGTQTGTSISTLNTNPSTSGYIVVSAYATGYTTSATATSSTATTYAKLGNTTISANSGLGLFFSWTAVTNATSYDYIIYKGASTVYSSGNVLSTSTLAASSSGWPPGTTGYLTITAKASGYTSSSLVTSSTYTVDYTGTVISYVIGAGGAGGAANSNGVSGNPSTVMTTNNVAGMFFLDIKGNGGGNGYNGTLSTAVGAGGTAVSGWSTGPFAGTVKAATNLYTGGNGGTGGNTSAAAGGGGGGAVSGTAGGNGTNSSNGGAGALGATLLAGSITVGSAGAAGNSTTKNGGDGGQQCGGGGGYYSGTGTAYGGKGGFNGGGGGGGGSGIGGNGGSGCCYVKCSNSSGTDIANNYGAYQTVTSSGSLTAPAGTTKIEVWLIGGGGGGGGYKSGASAGSGGGAGGAAYGVLT